MQNPRHLCKNSRLALYKQPHLVQFHIVVTHVLDWSGVLHYIQVTLPYYKSGATHITLRKCQETIGKYLLKKNGGLNNVLNDVSL